MVAVEKRASRVKGKNGEMRRKTQMATGDSESR